MTALLALITVATWGVWIPLAQIVPGISQRSRTFYVTVGNLAFAALALLIGGGHLFFGWRTFWLPLAGGVLWTAGNFAAFRSAEAIGLARAAGTWTPLNVIVAFVWGALLFGELDHFSAARFALLAAALILVLIGMLLIVGSQNTPAASTPARAVQAARDAPSSKSTLARSAPSISRDAVTSRTGWLWGGAAGVLWGSYFVPAQWANVPARIANVPLAIGIFAAGSALVLVRREPTRLSLRSDRPMTKFTGAGQALVAGLGLPHSGQNFAARGIGLPHSTQNLVPAPVAGGGAAVAEAASGAAG